MDCLEFRTAYSEFTDGLLDETGEIGARRHLRECLPCRHFHETFQQAVAALRRRPQVAPSGDFGVRLECRLRTERTRSELRSSRRSAAAAVLATATILAGGLVVHRLSSLDPRTVQAAPRPGVVPLLGGHHDRSGRDVLAAEAVNDVAVQDPLFVVTPGIESFGPHRPSYTGQLTASWTGR